MSDHVSNILSVCASQARRTPIGSAQSKQASKQASNCIFSLDAQRVDSICISVYLHTSTRSYTHLHGSTWIDPDLHASTCIYAHLRTYFATCMHLRAIASYVRLHTIRTVVCICAYQYISAHLQTNTRTSVISMCIYVLPRASSSGFLRARFAFVESKVGVKIGLIVSF